MNKPILLAEFSAASLWSSWVSYGAGVWYTDFSGAYPLVDSVLAKNMETKTIIGEVGAVFYEGEALLRAESITVLLVAPSFYWERSTSTLYARFPSFDPPNDSVRVGVKYYVASHNYDDNEGHIYLSLLKNTPPLAQTKDRIFFKKISTGTWTLTLDNASGLFDDLPNWGVYNQGVTYYIGEESQAIDKFVAIKAGRIKDFTFNGSDVNINVQDLRSRLSTRVPVNTVALSAYPNLDPKNDGKVVPIAFGENYGIAPLCINSLSTSGPYVFLLADPFFGSLDGVTQVRVNDAAITPSSVDLAACTITLTAAQVKDGASFKKVSVDVRGHRLNGTYTANPLEILRFLIEKLTLTPFTETFYNTAEWLTHEGDMPSVGIYADNQVQILTIVEQIMASTRGGFLITNDGRYSWLQPNHGKRPKFFVRDIDWLDMPVVEYDTDEVISYARVGYKQNVSDRDSQYTEAKQYVREVYNQFNVVNNETFETLLVSEAKAKALGDSIMELSRAPAVVVSGAVPLSFIDMRIGENIQAEVNRLTNGVFSPWLGTVRGEIISAKPDVLASNMKIEFRVVDGIPEYVESSGAAAIYGLSVYGNAVYGGSVL